ncbi:hypothetical protein L3X38_043761 [Prunus dulcis]|uniref:Uncharacterized protein n=1 Tax=Prunus dulcis TaxID=3755 RepID=A0AAD4UXB8_PRUDU|nr:hypothetical protein L3X38_043761 [Prunus dulcis]
MPQRDYNSSPIPNMFPQIMANDLTSLIANVNISEVKNSLFNIGGLKTPGVDGKSAHLLGRGLHKVLEWRLGKGDKVKFWKDKWIDVVPHMNQVDITPEIDLNTMVSDFFVNSWWDVEKLRGVLPEEWVQKVIGCPADFGGSFG